MSAIIQRFSVGFEYPVYLTTDLFLPSNPTLLQAIAWREPQRRHRLCFVLDRAVAEARPGLVNEIEAFMTRHPASLDLMAEPAVVEGGELAKNLPGLVYRLQAKLHALRADRHSFVVAVGGGAVLDLAGYAASTVHRGLRIVRVPTTVLAQCDSAVGVKTGINAFGKKNFLGTFAPPFAVINDDRFLETLERLDKIAGIAEAVKVALIRDADFFAWLTKRAHDLACGDSSALARLIRRSAQLHLRHIAECGDPFETGSARPLDFGHWAAHKLESLSGYRLRHGEAVAIGLAIDSCYSHLAGLLAEAELIRILCLLKSIGLPLWDDALEREAGGRRLVLDGLAEFREHLGGPLTVTLLAGVGRAIDVNELSPELILRAIDRLRREDASHATPLARPASPHLLHQYPSRRDLARGA